MLYAPAECQSFFIITLLTSAERVLSELTIHQPAQAVTDITISIPQSVDLCTLCGRISAGNSGGMCHSEPVRVGKIFVIEHVQLHNIYISVHTCPW